MLTPGKSDNRPYEVELHFSGKCITSGSDITVKPSGEFEPGSSMIFVSGFLFGSA
jgi:hypothetical protein